MNAGDLTCMIQYILAAMAIIMNKNIYVIRIWHVRVTPENY